MKNRSSFTIFTTIFSVLACFGLAFGAGGPESPDPSPFPVNSNTADGFRALENSANAFNSAFGWFSSFTNPGATFFSTGLGAGTLFFNDGADNTAVGTAAMFFNTTGPDNTAVGINALRDNTTGDRNCAFGSFALFNNQVAGNASNAFGYQALFNNDSDGLGNGQFNNAFGWEALWSNVDGIWNTAMGDAAGAGITGSHNVAIGASSMASATGDDNVAVGFNAANNGGTGFNNIYIGTNVFGVAGDIRFIRIGDTTFTDYDCFIAGIQGRSPGVGVPEDVGITPDGKLFSPFVSSRQFKHDIKLMDKASEVILALKPVTFHYNSDPTNTACFGLIAEEVAEVSPDLVIPDKEGKPYSVRYRDLNVMLLNEFLKEHKKVEAQQASISQLKSEMQTMVAQLKEQAAQIQKVSVQLEVNKPAPQVVVNKP